MRILIAVVTFVVTAAVLTGTAMLAYNLGEQDGFRLASEEARRRKHGLESASYEAGFKKAVLLLRKEEDSISRLHVDGSVVWDLEEERRLRRWADFRKTLFLRRTEELLDMLKEMENLDR